mmetsp:Transcript_1096/g.2009  ORF Transcript_1096/g.2009 Transcript_1096/m.2009 type:complete len:308 (+) Transcript_1096:297-1220(+)
MTDVGDHLPTRLVDFATITVAVDTKEGDETVVPRRGQQPSYLAKSRPQMTNKDLPMTQQPQIRHGTLPQCTVIPMRWIFNHQTIISHIGKDIASVIEDLPRDAFEKLSILRLDLVQNRSGMIGRQIDLDRPIFRHALDTFQCVHVHERLVTFSRGGRLGIGINGGGLLLVDAIVSAGIGTPNVQTDSELPALFDLFGDIARTVRLQMFVIRIADGRLTIEMNPDDVSKHEQMSQGWKHPILVGDGLIARNFFGNSVFGWTWDLDDSDGLGFHGVKVFCFVHGAEETQFTGQSLRDTKGVEGMVGEDA